jgi:Arc/MetJ family transcription regulator
MATNLALDDRLIEAAVEAGGHKTKKAAVTAALQEYVGRRERARVTELFGRIEYAPDHDYKAERHRKTP